MTTLFSWDDCFHQNELFVLDFCLIRFTLFHFRQPFVQSFGFRANFCNVFVFLLNGALSGCLCHFSSMTNFVFMHCHDLFSGHPIFGGFLFSLEIPDLYDLRVNAIMFIISTLLMVKISKKNINGIKTL